jgi:hypothetical protein
LLLYDVSHALWTLRACLGAHDILRLRKITTFFPAPRLHPLLLLPRQIEPSRRILILPQTRHHLLRTQRLDHNPRIPWAHEPSRHSVLNPINQARPVIVDIQHNHRHAVYPQLIPRRHLHELLERAVTPGQRDESAPRTARDDFLGHEALARVHVVYEGCAAVNVWVDVVRSRRGIVVRFQRYEGPWDDAVDGGGARERDQRARDFAHETNGAAAVDEGGVGGVEGVGEVARRRHVHGGCAFGGAAAGRGISG